MSQELYESLGKANTEFQRLIRNEIRGVIDELEDTYSLEEGVSNNKNTYHNNHVELENIEDHSKGNWDGYSKHDLEEYTNKYKTAGYNTESKVLDAAEHDSVANGDDAYSFDSDLKELEDSFGYEKEAFEYDYADANNIQGYKNDNYHLNEVDRTGISSDWSKHSVADNELFGKQSKNY